MTQKKRQKLRSSYINGFISNRRKINSKKGLCGDTRLHMPFRTKKKIKYVELPWNEKNLPEDQKIMNWEKAKNILNIQIKIRPQPRKLQMDWNLEDMLGV